MTGGSEAQQEACECSLHLASTEHKKPHDIKKDVHAAFLIAKKSALFDNVVPRQ